MTFNVHITHTSTSQTHAVDVLLQLEIPFYLKLLNYGHGTGLEWTSVDKSEPSILKFKVKSTGKNSFLFFFGGGVEEMWIVISKGVSCAHTWSSMSSEIYLFRNCLNDMLTTSVF